MASATVMNQSPTVLTDQLSMSKFNTNITASQESNIDQLQVKHWTELLQQELNALHGSQSSSSGQTLDDSHLVNPQVMHAPRRRSSQPALAAQIAWRLYPALTPEKAVRNYEADIKSLRSSVTRQQWATAKQGQPKDTWRDRILKQGPWLPENDAVSTAGPSSLPMPVEVATKDSLVPIFEHLRNGGTIEMPANDPFASSAIEPGSGMRMVEYPKGVLYADGRVDLCKMVVGPRSIQDLMDSLKPNPFVKHFLLGNNIIGAVGAKAIASFIDELPDQMETWYLAGNCINNTSLTLLVNSMIRSATITNVWLKRNPLGPSAADDIARLIMQSSIQTLDLDQTELGDVGVAHLFSALYSSSTPIILKHIYLNACGISSAACTQIALFLASPNCALESLYISCNPIGPAVARLATGIKHNQSLHRLTLQSCGLESQSTIALLKAATGHPSLMRLDLGQAYATEDLSQRYNWLTDDCAPALAALLRSTSLRYLAIDDVPMSMHALNIILTEVTTSTTIEFFSAKSLFNGLQEKNGREIRKEYLRRVVEVTEILHGNVQRVYGCSYDDFLNHHKRALQSPPGIELIDSVYRNRDAGLARRGLKRLDKHWDDEDDSVVRSEEGCVW